MDDAENDDSGRRRWQALSVCLLAGFMTLLDVSIVNIALPSIQSSLGAREADLQWVVSGYTLAFGLVLVTAGRIGDARGAATRSSSESWRSQRRARPPGWPRPRHPDRRPDRAGRRRWGHQPADQRADPAVVPRRGARPGLRSARRHDRRSPPRWVPLLGGFLIFIGGPEHGWRWIFFVNLPVGALAVVLAMRLIPGHPAGHRRERLDPIGVVLLGAAMLLLLLPLVETRQLPRPVAGVLLVLGVGMLVAFWAWERRYARTANRWWTRHCSGRRSFAMGFAIALLYFAGFTAIFFIFSLYLQEGLGYSALEAGLTLSPFAIGSATASAVGGRFVSRLGRPLVATGLIVVGVGVGATMVAAAVVPGPKVGWAMALPLLVAGVGSGLVVTPNITLTLSEVPVRQGGTAGGVLQTSQRLGAAAGIAIVGSVFFATVGGTEGDWSRAFRYGLLVTLGFVLVSLLVTFLDVRTNRRRTDR